MTFFSKHAARWVAAAIVTTGAVGTTGALALSSAEASVAKAGAATAAPRTLTVKQIAFGAKLSHKFQANGTGPWLTEPLAGPDDISRLGRSIFVGFQNGVGSTGGASAHGNLDSTVAEFSLSGKELRQWDVTGKVDGLTADPYTEQVVATVNEDGNSSLYTISADSGKVVHYSYNEPLPHNGGTDAISIYQRQLVISASAPGSTGAAAPQASYPAVYVVRLNAKSKVATVYPLYSDEATATAVNGPDAGKPVTLGLTDPDSSEVVPARAPAFAGDYMLNSQGDQQLIFGKFTWWGQWLSVLSISQSVDDSAWPTSKQGALYTTDSTADTVDIITGSFKPGTVYTAVTPCNANAAPATCPGGGFGPNYLGTINLKTGEVTPVTLSGDALQPKGMIFVG
jgi:hypothetical protein